MKSHPHGRKEGRRKYFCLATTIIVAILLILSFFFSIDGKTSLLRVALFGFASILAGILFVQGSIHLWKVKKQRTMILVFLTGLILLGFGAVSELHVANDLHSGPQTAVLTNTQIISRTGAHGILGLRYYLKGTDPQNHEMQFPISAKTHRLVDGSASVQVRYYPHTGRLVEFRSVAEAVPHTS